MMVSTEETVAFMAQLSPRRAGQGLKEVTLKLYRSDRKDPIPIGRKYMGSFEAAGRYFKV